MLRKLVFIIFILSVISSSLLFMGCDKKAEDTGNAQSEGDDTETTVATEPVQAVCIYDGELRFRKEPEYESEISGTLSKGEKITFMGKIEEGPGYKSTWEYYLIKRLDGTEGWAWGDYIVPESTPAVTVEKTSTYDQPSDVKINMDFSLEPMSIIAIVEDNGSWLKIAYKDKNNLIWIKPGTLSYAEIDIAVANLANTALDSDNVTADLESILEIDAFRDSVFINLIHEKLYELEADPGKLSDEELMDQALTGEGFGGDMTGDGR